MLIVKTILRVNAYAILATGMAFLVGQFKDEVSDKKKCLRHSGRKFKHYVSNPVLEKKLYTLKFKVSESRQDKCRTNN